MLRIAPQDEAVGFDAVPKLHLGSYVTKSSSASPSPFLNSTCPSFHERAKGSAVFHDGMGVFTRPLRWDKWAASLGGANGKKLRLPAGRKAPEAGTARNAGDMMDPPERPEPVSGAQRDRRERFLSVGRQSRNRTCFLRLPVPAEGVMRPLSSQDVAPLTDRFAA